MTEKKKNLITRTLTGIIFLCIMILGLLKPIGMIVLFTLITAGMTIEYAQIINKIKDVRINVFISATASAYFFLCVAGINSGFIRSNGVFIPYLLTVMYLLISELYTHAKQPVLNWAYTMLGQMYIALPLSMINVLAFRQDMQGETHFHYMLPLSIFIFIWVSDTGAYCTGSLLGRHKLFPRISPAKSWEGAIGGVTLAVITSIILAICERQITPHHMGLAQWMGLSIVVTVFAIWGDLVESLLKRTLGIKDSGSILPGHGGLLDRFDSAIMGIPAAVIYLYTLTLI